MDVQTIPPIEEMTQQQRVDLMEELWRAMAKSAEQMDSPSWHEDVLRERDRKLADGETSFRDWEVAKADILRRTIGGHG